MLGGARSGKSRYALEVGESLSVDRVFVATGWVSMRGCGSGFRADRDSSLADDEGGGGGLGRDWVEVS